MIFNNFFVSIYILFIMIAGTTFVNYYYNFYHIYKYLDYDQKLGYFKNTFVINICSKYIFVKKILVYYILIPIIKINYYIILIFITLLYSLCYNEFKDFIIKQNNIILEKNNEKINNEEEINEEEINKEEEINNEEINNEEEINNDMILNHNDIKNINKDYENNIINIMNFIEYNDEYSLNISDLNKNNNLDNTEKNINYKEIKSDNDINILSEIESLNKENELSKKINDYNDIEFSDYLIIKKDNFNNKLLDDDKSNYNNMTKIMNNIKLQNEIESNIDNEIIETINVEEIDFGKFISEFVQNETSNNNSNNNSNNTSSNNSNNNSVVKIGKKKK